MKELTCERCHGSGKVQLPEHLQATLDLIPRRSTITAHMLHGKKPSVSANAFNNRLLELLAAGFVAREKSGRYWLYSRTHSAK